MDRCAVFVDAGYLHESAKTLLTAGHPGATVRANAIALVSEIASLAVAQTQLPLLRIYWYAAAPNRNPYPDQRELASLQDIKLRLGNLRERAGGRMVQKGVDAELHADMTGLARNRGAVDFVLLSGDEDLLRAVDEVQSYGVRVHLWGVEAGPDGGNQSLELIAAADRRHVLEEAWLSNVFVILEPPKPDSPMASGGLASRREPNGGSPGTALSGMGPHLARPIIAAARPTFAGAAPMATPVSATPVQASQAHQDEAAESPGVAGTDAAQPLAEDAGGGDGDAQPGLPEPGGATAPSHDAGRDSDVPGAATAPDSPADQPDLAAGNPDLNCADAAERADASQQLAPQPDPAPGEATTDGARPAIPKPTDLRPRPTPALVRAPASTIIYTASPGQPGYSPRPDYAFYRLSDLTTQAEQYADAAEDELINYDAISVGKVYARRWLSRATTEAASMLSQEYPTIPRAVDAELLRYAVNRGVDTWTSETDKFAVRQGFWVEVRVHLQQLGRPATPSQPRTSAP